MKFSIARSGKARRNGGGATFAKTDFANTDDEAFLPGFDVDDAASNLGCERFLEFRLNVLERPGRGSGADDALHGLHEPLHIGGSFNVLHGLYLGERHGFGVTERDAGVGCLKNTEFLESDLNREREFADAALVPAKKHREQQRSKEQSDEVRIADQISCRAMRRFRPEASKFKWARIHRSPSPWIRRTIPSANGRPAPITKASE
jgi:hypothetical protein